MLCTKILVVPASFSVLHLGLVIAQAFTLMLPITFSGLTLIVCMRKGWLAKLDVPLDAGLQLGGAPLIGRSKSLRSLVIYLIVATVVTSALHLISLQTDLIATVYKANPLVLAPLATVAYLLGEISNSFIKRRLGIATSGQVVGSGAGRIQAIFDNIDGMLTSGLVFIFIYGVPTEVLIASFVLAIVTHLSTDALMRRLHLKRK